MSGRTAKNLEDTGLPEGGRNQRGGDDTPHLEPSDYLRRQINGLRQLLTGGGIT